MNRPTSIYYASLVLSAVLMSAHGASTIFQCYSCVSGTLSEVSREMFSQILPSALAVKNNSLCDDPFNSKEATLVEPCSSSCVKVVSSNKCKFACRDRVLPLNKLRHPVFADTKLLLRGCLSSIYQRVGSGENGYSKKVPGSSRKSTENKGLLARRRQMRRTNPDNQRPWIRGHAHLPVLHRQMQFGICNRKLLSTCCDIFPSSPLICLPRMKSL